MTGRSVQLFATCLGDLFLPDAVSDTARLLEQAGYRVEFPGTQVCCGQPAFNAGYHGAARRVARTFTRAFSRSAPIIAPSGSCTSFVAHSLPALLDCQPYPIYEFSQFMVAADIAIQRLNQGVAVAYHHSCHMLRGLGVAREPESLLDASGAIRVPLRRPDLCCGFGGVFAARHPEMSCSMADEKLSSAPNADVIVTADPGCLLHLQTRAAATGGPPVMHLASFLARGVKL